MSNQVQRYTATQLIQSPAMQKKFQEVLGEKKNQFVASLISALNTNPSLADCEPNSVIFAALTAASLDLPINPTLGFAHIVPYNVKGQKKAQFQIGYKGLIQLAIRTGQYKKINALEIKKGELKNFDRITEEIEVNFIEDEAKRNELPTMGYIAYFELMNGFNKLIYWSKEQMETHAKTYSQAYRTDLTKNTYDSFWSKDFDSQGLKTVLKQLISKWGIMSIEMRMAIERDQAVIDENENTIYIDNPDNEQVTEIDEETTTISKEDVKELLAYAFKDVGEEKGKQILIQALVELDLREIDVEYQNLKLSNLTIKEYKDTLAKIDEIKARQ